MSRIRWFGDRAVVVSVTSRDERHRLMHVLKQTDPRWAVRSGMGQILVEVGSPRRDLLEAVTTALAVGAGEISPDSSTGQEILIDVHYVGADLSSVASHFAVPVADVIAAHTEQVWQVEMMGFAPGFGYLEPVGPHLLDWASLGRRDSPRERVPQGSIAVAAGMSAIYPQDMPGGWHLIGSTAQRLVDLADEQRPTLLAAGDIVRFGALHERGA